MIGIGAGGDDQLVVGNGDRRLQRGLAGARRHELGGDGARRAVDRRDLGALVERDAVLDVPAVAMDHDLLERLLARQHRRQHDAVVVHPRLGVEDRHVVGVGRGLEQPLEGAAGRHAVADDDESLLRVRGHRVHPTNKRTRRSSLSRFPEGTGKDVGGIAEYPSLGEALESGPSLAPRNRQQEAGQFTEMRMVSKNRTETSISATPGGPTLP